MTYTRPPLNLGEYLDESGAPIPYGRRWGMGSPPEDTYSVTRHPERFAPLVDVARALREHLIETYDVTVEGDTLVPSDPAAPLTFTETDFPLTRVSAGVTGFIGAWICGCDACDDDVEEVAETLENFVFAVVGGHFQETLRGRTVWTAWSYGRGGMSAGTRLVDLDKPARAALRKAKPWQPWPLREANPGA